LEFSSLSELLLDRVLLLPAFLLGFTVAVFFGDLGGNDLSLFLFLSPTSLSSSFSSVSSSAFLELDLWLIVVVEDLALTVRPLSACKISIETDQNRQTNREKHKHTLKGSK
jgi:hypothetical protein